MFDFFNLLVYYMFYYNILTTGYRNFGQSDWFPTQDI